MAGWCSKKDKLRLIELIRSVRTPAVKKELSELLTKMASQPKIFPDQSQN